MPSAELPDHIGLQLAARGAYAGVRVLAIAGLLAGWIRGWVWMDP